MLFVSNISRSKSVSVVSPDNYYRLNIRIFKIKTKVTSSK